MRARYLTFALWASLVAEPACAVSPSVPSAVEQWGIEEVDLLAPRPPGNPYVVELAADFVSGTHRITAPGFYAGGDHWKVRLMPPQQGIWHFRTRSPLPGLNGKTGRFRVTAPAPGDHGPVQVVKNFHFGYADGTPFFPLGTTLYNWLNRDPALEHQTLATLSKSPFNKIRFGIFPKWLVYNRVEPPAYPFVRKADGSFDFDRFNPAYFEHIERRIADLQKLGIEAEVILFHPYDRWGFARMSPAQDAAYVHYAAARLSAYRNVWWTMSNEFNVFGFNLPWGGPTPLHAKDWDRLFQVLEAADPYHHLAGMHNAGPWYDPAKPWISHVVAQEAMMLGPIVRTARQRYNKPVIIEELGYEGDVPQSWGNLTAREELGRIWEVVMAGGYASHGETFVQPGGNLWWAVGGQLRGETPPRLGFMRSVVTALPFQDMVPAPDHVVGGSALIAPGKAYLFYFGSATARPTQVLTEGAKAYRVELIDPWQMKTFDLGVTGPGPQAFASLISPLALRFTALPDREAVRAVSLGKLVGDFAGEPQQSVPNLVAFTSWQAYLNPDLQLGQIVATPGGRELVSRFAPQLLKTLEAHPVLSVIAFTRLRATDPESSAIAREFQVPPFGLPEDAYQAIASRLGTVPFP